MIAADKRLTQKNVAKECAEWLKEKAEIRSMVKPNFLHGKMYRIAPSNGGENQAIVGSSNFTVSGLGVGNNKNIELNLVIDSKQQLKELKAWFETIWNDKS